MSKLPTGAVTFLFTDIEGSTKLSQDFPDEMPVLLARHNEILENAIKAQNGFIFNIVGDSYHAAFHETEQALNAALEAQRNLHHEPWSPAPIKVRMGIHSGNVTLEDPNSASPYTGYATLALTSRVMSAGHGEQILLSQDAVNSLTTKQVELKDMGEHNLKDVQRPQQLYQVVVSDLPQEFPPLKTQKVINHNLPLNLTSFIGREKEISEIKAKLEESRLLTLIGPGGTGKTRLSIQVGMEVISNQPNGVWMVELAPISDPALIPQTVASIFGLREGPGKTLLDQINDYLRAKSLLLILDNCEHLVESAAKFTDDILKACPQIKILASSREALGVPGEKTYRVPSLLMPDDENESLDAISKYEAVQLFIERATAANPKFELTKKNGSSIAQICRRLDGIPLALELAAARAKVLSVEQIAERLDDRFRLLTGGSRTALPRQQTLRAMIDWSYGLLSEPEKALFRRLAVFEGGWDLESGEKVCSGNGVDEYEVLDLMTQLVDKSLIIADEKDGNVRYHRLETIRQYAREKLLETDESTEIRNRHLDYFIKRISKLEEGYINPFQYEMTRKISPDFDNVRSAFTWALDKDLIKAAELVSFSVICWPWIFLGKISEFQEWCETVLKKIDGMAKTDTSYNFDELRGRVLNRYSQTLMNMGDHKASCVAAEESIKIARESNDIPTLTDAFGSLGHCAVYAGDEKKALEAAHEGIELSEQHNLYRQLVWCLDSMTHIYRLNGNNDKLIEYYDKIKEVLQKSNVPSDHVYFGAFKIEQALRQGKTDEAEKHMGQVLEAISQRNDSYMFATMQSMFAHALRGMGELDKAAYYYKITIRLWKERGHPSAIAHQLECFGFIALAHEDAVRATKLFSAADTARNTINSVRTPSEQKEFEEAVAQLKTGMDTDEFEKVWENGQTITLDDAVEFALEEAE